MASRLPSFFTKALLATALLGTGSAYAADAVGIVVYNAQHESLTKAWVEGFTQETGIPVTIRNGDDTEMGNQIVQEGAASRLTCSSPRTPRPWCWSTTPGCSRRWRQPPWNKWTPPTAPPTASGSALRHVRRCLCTTRAS